jgi:hypothetical protein
VPTLIVVSVLVAYVAVGSSTSDSHDGDRRTSSAGGPEVEARADANPRHAAKRRYRSRAQFPRPATTGVPAGWEPSRVRTEDLHVTQPGRTVKNVLLQDADVIVSARNVTIRRVKLKGGVITNQAGGCGEGLTVANTTIAPAPGEPFGGDDAPVIGEGAYTAKRVEIRNRGEGFRASDCGPVRIKDSFAYIKGDTPDCDRDLHSDGIQGYYARGLTVRNATIIFGNDCGTSPYFIGYGPDYPDEPPINTGKYSVRRLLVAGGGYVFRHQVRGSITGLRIVANSWVFGPIDNACSAISRWEAKIVKINHRYKVTRAVREQRCDTETRD